MGNKFYYSLRDAHMNRPNFDLMYSPRNTGGYINKQQRLKKSESSKKALGCTKRLFKDDVIHRQTLHANLMINSQSGFLPNIISSPRAVNLDSSPRLNSRKSNN